MRILLSKLLTVLLQIITKPIKINNLFIIDLLCSKVYISDGDVHIIPLASTGNKKSITVAQALEQIIKFPTATVATQDVNSAISSRLHG